MTGSNSKYFENNLRLDGRRETDLRALRCRMCVFDDHAARVDGSAYVEMGLTKVIASVLGPRERQGGAASFKPVTVEYSMATFSTSERKKKLRQDRRNKEVSLALEKVFEVAIMTNLFASSQISIHVEVLQSDGGAKCAAINAITLALIDAGIPMYDYVTSCSVGCIDNRLILDLNFLEECSRGAVVPVAIFPASERVLLLQLEQKLPLQKLEEAMQLSLKGCLAVHKVLHEAVKQHATDLLVKRGI